MFQKHTNSATKKCWGKNRLKKVRKSVFYIRTNIAPKKRGGKKLAKQLFQKHPNSATKKVGKQIVGKKFEKAFFIFARISYQKNGGKKTREIIFPETQE